MSDEPRIRPEQSGLWRTREEWEKNDEAIKKCLPAGRRQAGCDDANTDPHSVLSI